MALVLNEEQNMLQESAREFLQKSTPVSHLRSLRDEQSVSGFSANAWKQMAEMGWPAIIIPESQGGLGFGYTGMGVVLQEAGRTLTPSPLLSSGMVAASAIMQIGTEEQQASLLPAIATGEAIVVLAIDESSQHRPHQIEASAESTTTGFRINGSKLAVIDGMGSTHFLLTARVAGEDGVSLFIVPVDAGGVKRSASHALDTHVLANVAITQLELDASSRLGDRAISFDELDRVLDIARIGQSAELLGVASEAFERTMAYLRERKQFGVPIGSFQALQHRAAALYSELELCKSLVLHALQQLDEGREKLAEIASLTKSKLSEVAMNVTAEGIQMHGGIGMTDEFEIGFFYKRARILETLLGDRYFHLDRFALSRGY